MVRRLIISSFLISLAACSTSAQSGQVKTVIIRESINELEKEPVPGTVNEAWVEPMFGTARIPGSLDPDGVYYIPSRETPVLIRRDKFQKVQYPDYNGKYRNVK